MKGKENNNKKSLFLLHVITKNIKAKSKAKEKRVERAREDGRLLLVPFFRSLRCLPTINPCTTPFKRQNTSSHQPPSHHPTNHHPTNHPLVVAALGGSPTPPHMSYTRAAAARARRSAPSWLAASARVL